MTKQVKYKKENILTICSNVFIGINIYNCIYKAITYYNLFISLFTLLHSISVVTLTAVDTLFLFYSYNATKIFHL